MENKSLIKYSKKKVDKAGKILIDDMASKSDIEWAEDVLTYWRSLHTSILKTFYSTLKNNLQIIDPSSFVGQRLKRSPSIISKLKNSHVSKLSQMQDIAGLRAIVSDLSEVRSLEGFYKKNNLTHKFHDSYDYIDNPKDSGYRGIHLIYKYNSFHNPECNGLKIEIQIRTKLQHAWATAVETMGTFLNHGLKASEGPNQWLNFFSLAGSAFAYLEKSKPLSNYSYLSKKETYRKLISEYINLDVEKKLNGYTVAANHLSSEKNSGNFHLITLNFDSRILTVKSYGRKRIKEANEDYTKIERKIVNDSRQQVVLVSTESLNTLYEAYPNYFLDIQEFLNYISVIKKILKIKS